MNIELLKKPFRKIAADVMEGGFVRPRWGRPESGVYRIDVRDGIFQIAAREDVVINVVDLKTNERHLLLNVTETTTRQKHKFLLGFDERDWFVAAVPEKYTWVKNITDAKNVLKPLAVTMAERQLHKASKNIRKNKAWVRQGEWFFIPDTTLEVTANLIRKNEAISRGNGSKPHIVDEIYRERGEVVYVSAKYPAGISEAHYRKLISQKPAKRMEFRIMMKNSNVYAKGCVRHADHATIFLDGWHRVLMNTEAEAKSRTNLAFLD